MVHFSGHGLAARLVLEQPDGQLDVVSSKELIKLLQPGRGRLKWVTLSACLSAATTVAETLRWLGLEPTRRFRDAVEAETTASDRALPALAQTLVEHLHCAVLAMRYPVGDAFAIDLGERLYRGVLAQGQPLTRALQLALPDSLKSADCPPLAVTTPALFGSAAADFYLWRAGGPPAVALAHRLAAALIRLQTASGTLPSTLQGLTIHLADFTDNPPLPTNFAALCEIVEQVEGVRFRELFEQLPKDRAADGDAALRQVLALARQAST